MKIEENLCLEIRQEEKKKGIWKSSLKQIRGQVKDLLDHEKGMEKKKTKR